MHVVVSRLVCVCVCVCVCVYVCMCVCVCVRARATATVATARPSWCWKALPHVHHPQRRPAARCCSEAGLKCSSSPKPSCAYVFCCANCCSCSVLFKQQHNLPSISAVLWLCCWLLGRLPVWLYVFLFFALELVYRYITCTGTWLTRGCTFRLHTLECFRLCVCYVCAVGLVLCVQRASRALLAL
jgi:hypothetical protein